MRRREICFSLNSGRIDFDEFVEMIAEFYFKKYSRSEIREAFRRFDVNGDGFIDAKELKTILSKLGKNYSTEEVRQTNFWFIVRIVRF